MKVMKTVKKYFDDRNLKMIETLWLLYAHALGVIGAIWFICLESTLFYKYLLVSTHFNLRHSLYGMYSLDLESQQESIDFGHIDPTMVPYH